MSLFELCVFVALVLVGGVVFGGFTADRFGFPRVASRKFRRKVRS